MKTNIFKTYMNLYALNGLFFLDHIRHISSYKSEINKYFGNQLKWINQF